MTDNTGVPISPAYFTAVKEAEGLRSKLVSLTTSIKEAKEYADRHVDDTRMNYISIILTEGLNNVYSK